MPFSTPGNTQEQFFEPFKCISLACLPIKNSFHTRRRIIMEKPSQTSKKHDPRNLEDHNSNLPDVPQDNPLINDQAEPLSIQRSDLSKAQNKDPKLRMIIRYLLTEDTSIILADLDKQEQNWLKSISKRCHISDGLLFYHDEFMLTKSPRVFVPDNTNLKQRLLHSYHNSLLSSHRGRDATYSAISRDFYWRNLAKDVRRWVNRCTECIKYKTLTQKPSPMNVRMYLYPFHTLGI